MIWDKKVFVFSGLLFFFLIFSAFSQSYKHALEISERYYSDGDYIKALSNLEKIIIKEEKVNNERLLLKLTARKLKYLVALGKYSEFESGAEELLETQKKEEEPSISYVKSLLLVASYYIDYSDYSTAFSFLEEGENILEKVKKKRNDLEPEAWSFFDDKILYLQLNQELVFGEFEKAGKTIEKLESLREARTRSKEVYFEEETLEFQERKLTPFELRQRKNDLAEILTLKGILEKLRGNISLSKERFHEAENWIKKNLSFKGEAFIRNRYELCLMMLENNVRTEEAKDLLEKNIFLAERFLGLVHEVYLKIHEALIDYYIESRYFKKSRLQRWEMEVNTSRYYGKDTKYYATVERLEAKKNFYSKNYELARKKLNQLLSDYNKVPANHEERGEIVQQLYLVSIAQDNFSDAQGYLNKLIKTYKRVYGNESLPYLKAKLLLANFLVSYTNETEKIGQILSEDINVLKSKIDSISPLYIKVLDVEAKFFDQKDNVLNALKKARQASNIAKEIFTENSINYALSLQKLADVEIKAGKFKDVDSHILSSLNIYEESNFRELFGYKKDYAKALETAATYYSMLGLFEESSQYLSKAKRLNKRSVSSLANSNTIDFLANVYVQTGDYRSAKEILEKVIDLRKKKYGNDNQYLVTPYSYLARVALLQGEFVKADSLSEKAIDISNGFFGKGSLRATPAMVIKSNVNLAFGNFNKAEEIIRNVITTQEKVYSENHIELAQSYTQLAIAKSFSKENEDEVEAFLRKAKEIIVSTLGNTNPLYAKALKDLAVVLIQRNKLEEAENNLTIARALWSTRLKEKENIRSAEIGLHLGDLYIQKGDIVNAESEFLFSKKVFSSKLSNQHPLYVKATIGLSRTYYVNGDFSRSKKHLEDAIKKHLEYVDGFFPVLSDQEKANYWNLIKSDFEFYANLAQKDISDDNLRSELLNYVLKTKSVLLSNSAKVRNRIINSNNEDLKRNYALWNKKKDQLLKALSSSQKQLKQEGIDLKKIENEVESIEKKLILQSGYFSKLNREKTNWKEIRNLLKPGEVAVEIYRYRFFDRSFKDSVIYSALVITAEANKAPSMVILPNGNDLESKHLAYYRTCMEFDLKDKESYLNFWKPIEKELNGATKVYFSGDGVYNQINLETITNEEGTYLIDSKNIVLVTSIKDLITKRSRTTLNRNIALFGNPVYYKGLMSDEYNAYNQKQISQLPGAYEEVVSIQKLLEKKGNLKVDAFLNMSATESKVKALQNPSILHLATHGFFLEDKTQAESNELLSNFSFSSPLLRSGIIMNHGGDLMDSVENFLKYNSEDGILTAYEAMSLSLDSTSTVVLSACETGRGESKVGEGVYGLQRALMIAGAESLIMSLFEVQDEATLKLMLNFYQNWIDKKMGKREAFLVAKKTLRESFPEPRYWGAFVMLGGLD